MAGNWTSWPETGQLTSFAKNGIIPLILEPLYILKVSKCTLFDRKLKCFPCIFKKLYRLQTKVAGNWATYCNLSRRPCKFKTYVSALATYLSRFSNNPILCRTAPIPGLQSLRIELPFRNIPRNYKSRQYVQTERGNERETKLGPSLRA